MIVYIAAPLTKGDRPKNLNRAIDAGERIANRGHVVFIPHLFDLWHLIHPHEYNFWMRQDLAWLRKCEVLVRLHGFSEGADKEEGLARQWGLAVYGSATTDGLNEFMNSQHWCMTNEY